jgi:hypothetical protein
MSYFIVEHKRNGGYIMETIQGVEDIDTSMYKDILGIWVCDSAEEVMVMQNELGRMRHVRSSQSA